MARVFGRPGPPLRRPAPPAPARPAPRRGPPSPGVAGHGGRDEPFGGGRASKSVPYGDPREVTSLAGDNGSPGGPPEPAIRSGVPGPHAEASWVLDHVRDYAIFMLDRDGRILTWNRGAAAIKGYSADEIIGQHVSRFYPPEDVATGKPR